MKSINFYGLLFIKKSENKKLNFNSNSHNQKILVYLQNAILLNEQLKKQNFKFTLITNKKIYLEKLTKNLKCSLNILEIKFSTFVPKDTHFYSCHYRVDVFKYLSTQKNNYSILVDLDILIFGNLKKIFKKIKFSNAYVNDITSHVLPAYGKKTIYSNLLRLNKNITSFNWYGGDFFAGNNNFYKILFKRAQYFQKKFVQNIYYFKSQTDELFISAAINDIKSNKLFSIKKALEHKFFNRYWNTNVKHKQKKLNYYLSFKMLHLPADKIFISNCIEKIKNKINFKDDYLEYCNKYEIILKKKISKYLPYSIKNLMKKII